MKEFASFRLDSINQCLWRSTGSGGDERILLTPTEFGVLNHLVEQAGRLVTHRELLDAVWPRTAIEPQAVKSKIFHLRRLLDDDPREPRFIETVARRGYRFVAKIEQAVRDTSPAAPNVHLVGRDHALEQLRECMQTALTGRPQIVFITGESGIGKTALVDEFQRQLGIGDRTALVARGQCVEGFGTKEAFYPVLEAVRELCQGSAGSHVVDTLASHAPTWLVQFPALLTRQHRETLQQEILGATRVRMLREICEALETIARSAPVLLVLEDLHWADASTLDLLSALARRHVPARSMVLATYRPAQVAQAAQPLNALKRDLVARHLAREIALQPLTPDEIAQYLGAERSLAAQSNELASLLHRHTEGNPLFVIAVLEHLTERGLVESDRGAITLKRPAAEISLEVPESLRDAIGATIEQLGEEAQRLLDVAAIAGMTFEPSICAPLADMSVTAFDEGCESLARRGQVLRFADTRELPNGEVLQRYAFVHAAYRDVLYERQSATRRAMLHRRCAERMEELFAGALREVAAELAYHFEKGADWSRAVKYLRLAADGTAGRSAIEAAIGNLQHALALAAKLALPERVPAETEILETLADVYLGTFDARAADALTLLCELASRYGLIDVQAKALVDLAYPVAWSSSAPALDVIGRALELSEQQSDPLLRARTRARCTIRRIWINGWSEPDADECRRALDDIRRLGSPQEVAHEVIECNLLDFFSTQYHKASRDTVESLATLMRGHGAGMYLSYAHSLKELAVPWCRILLGEWGTALEELHAGITLAQKNGDAHRMETLQLSRAWLLLHAMDFPGARAICEALLRAFDHPARAPWRRFCLTVFGAAEVGLGNRDAALGHLLAAREEMDRHPALGDWYWSLRLQHALTELWLLAGDLNRARSEGELFRTKASLTAERTWQALAWEVNARIALRAGEPRCARDLIRSGISAIEGFEAPVAAWQVHATAADACRASGDETAAAHHREKSCAIIHGLAASLGAGEEALRRTFLTASPVSRVIAGGASTPRMSQEQIGNHITTAR